MVVSKICIYLEKQGSVRLVFSEAEIEWSFLNKDIVIGMWSWVYTTCSLDNMPVMDSTNQWYKKKKIQVIDSVITCLLLLIVQFSWSHPNGMAVNKVTKWRFRSITPHLLVCWDAKTARELIDPQGFRVTTKTVLKRTGYSSWQVHL